MLFIKHDTPRKISIYCDDNTCSRLNKFFRFCIKINLGKLLIDNDKTDMNLTFKEITKRRLRLYLGNF